MEENKLRNDLYTKNCAVRLGAPVATSVIQQTKVTPPTSPSIILDAAERLLASTGEITDLQPAGKRSMSAAAAG